MTKAKKYIKACRARHRWLWLIGWVRKRADAADERAITAYGEMIDAHKQEQPNDQG